MFNEANTMLTRPVLPLHHPATLLATWGGSGLLKRAPGTWGSLAALPFAWAIETWLGHMALLTGTVIIFFIGWWATAVYMQSGTAGDDPKEVVIDEVAGQWLLLSILPLTVKGYLAGFLLVRFFDIVKPWPVSFADKHIKGAFGVMLDDILAACYPVVLLVVIDPMNSL